MELQQVQPRCLLSFIMKVLCTNPTLHMLSTLCSSAAAAFVLAASMLSSVAVHCLNSLCRHHVVFPLPFWVSNLRLLMTFNAIVQFLRRKLGSWSSLPLRWETCKEMNRNEAQGVATNGAGRWKVYGMIPSWIWRLKRVVKLCPSPAPRDVWNQQKHKGVTILSYLCSQTQTSREKETK